MIRSLVRATPAHLFNLIETVVPWLFVAIIEMSFSMFLKGIAILVMVIPTLVTQEVLCLIEPLWLFDKLKILERVG